MADPLVTASLINAGGGFLGGLGQMFAGQSSQERANEDFTRAQTGQVQANTRGTIADTIFKRDSRNASTRNFMEAKNKFVGKNVYDPQQGKTDVIRGLQPMINKMAGRYNQKLGNISSGIAEHDLSTGVLNNLGQFFAQGGRENARLSSDRDLSILMGNPMGRI